MDGVILMPPEQVSQMFSWLHELKLDVSGVRRKFLNCPYGENPKQALDIYLPNEGGGPFPIVFFIHGGGWAKGKRNDNQLVPFIGGVEKGYAVISIGYRLTPYIRYPENLYDIKAALRWVAQNAETYLLDRSRTALAGSSAGAHLALMAAFTAGQAAFEGAAFSETCTIRAVVNQFGPTNFPKMHTHYDQSGYPRADAPDPDSMNALDTLLSIKADSVPEILRFLNPVDNIHKNIPPVLSQHGRYDPIVPYQQAVELHEAISAIAGSDKTEIDISEEFLHADPGYFEPESVERVFSFLDKHVK